MRAQFFHFLQTNAVAAVNDPAALVRLARNHPYYTWFTAVAVRRYHPALHANPEKLQHNFAERVRASQALLSSFHSDGFDDAHPVRVRRSVPGARTETGVPVSQALHLDDGAHRMALLLATQGEYLAPQAHRVFRRPIKVVMDNTALMLAAIETSEQRYARFVSLGFSDLQHSSLDDLRADVRESEPGRLTELEQVIAAHAPLLSSRREDPAAMPDDDGDFSAIWPVSHCPAESG